jgi:hypothetical protein
MANILSKILSPAETPDFSMTEEIKGSLSVSNNGLSVGLKEGTDEDVDITGCNVGTTVEVVL